MENPNSEVEQLKVACHDLGEYVRYYARGKQVLESLGIKSHIMRLMAHSNKHVKYAALTAVQKIMVQNWEFMGTLTAKGGSGKMVDVKG